MGCPQRLAGSEKCGAEPYTDGSSYCRTHFQHRYPTTFDRLEREIDCEPCHGTGWVHKPGTEIRVDCVPCNGRGKIDPKARVEKKP
jgi:hypothetical protein